jgi:hypothetical protein
MVYYLVNNKSKYDYELYHKNRRIDTFESGKQYSMNLQCDKHYKLHRHHGGTIHFRVDELGNMHTKSYRIYITTQQLDWYPYDSSRGDGNCQSYRYDFVKQVWSPPNRELDILH